MSTDHFNELSEAETERLAIVIEECGEVIQAGCKILRHGYESHNPLVSNRKTNRESLAREIGDLLHAVNRLTECNDVDARMVGDRARSKPEHIKPYLHHQPTFPVEESAKP